MLASGLLWRTGAGPAWRLALDAGIAEAIRKRLAMFVLRSKVTLAIEADLVVDRRRRPAGAGRGRRRRSASSRTALPRVRCRRTARRCWRWPDGRVVVVAPAAEADALVRRLAQHAAPATAAVWRWLGIRAGVPVITTATQDRHVAQTANFDALGGLSFTKGCYPGQEIVARTQHLGILKERAHPFRSAAPAPARVDAGLQRRVRRPGLRQRPRRGRRARRRQRTARGRAARGGRRRRPEARSIDGRALARLPLPYELPLARSRSGRSCDARRTTSGTGSPATRPARARRSPR